MSEIDALADSGAIEDLPRLPSAPSEPVNADVPDPGAPTVKLTAEHARLTRLLGLGCSTRLAQQDATLSFEFSHAESIDWPDALALVMPRGAIELEQGVRFMRAMTQIDVTDELEADDERWEWMQAALAGRLSGTPFDGIDRILRDVKPDGVDAVILRVTLRTGTHAVTTHMRGAAGAWLDVLQRADWTHRRLPVDEFLSLPYESTVCVARHTLPAAALRAITASDIVLPDSAAFKCDGEGSIQFSGMRLRVRYRAPCMLDIIDMEERLDAEELDASEGFEEEGQADFPAEEPASPGDGTPEEAPDEPPGEGVSGEEASRLDTIPVTLDFELGKVRMALGDMRALGPGAVLPLRGGSPSSISIVTSGRELGRGELVDVDGRLGIRVTQWWSR